MFDKPCTRAVPCKLPVLDPRHSNRWLIAFSSCALALLVVGLATLAKQSQYQTGTGAAGYLAKATKMTGERCQLDALVAPIPCPMPELLFYRQVLLPEPVFGRPVCMGSFRFRPPPVFFAG